MKITILNGKTIREEHLLWDYLEKQGECKHYNNVDSDYLKENSSLIDDTDLIISSAVSYNKTLLSKCKNLKYLGLLATGYSNIDLEYAKNKGIIVTNIPKYSGIMVAQWTATLMLAITGNLKFYSYLAKSGQWNETRKFHTTSKPIVELYGKTLGIIGYGDIGRKVGKIFKALGLNIVINDILNITADGVFDKQISLNELLNVSDCISINCPLNNNTSMLLSKNEFNQMKDGVFIVNTARGEIIDEEELYKAICSRKVAAAGLDTLKDETMKKYNPLFSLENCLITPHIGGASSNSMERLLSIALNNVKSFIENEPVNVVNSDL